jgi:hypothetical protein
MKLKALEILAKSGMNPSQFIIENSGNLTINNNGEQKEEAGEQKESEENEGIKHEDLAKAVSAVQSYMWGASAYAVLYCELRDHRGYLGNVAQLEREIDGIADEMKLDWSCKEGTISDAFRNNPFLEKHVDRWKEIGAKSRVIHLLDHLQQVLP